MLSPEAISIDQLGLIAPWLHIYITFFLLQFIFHKILQVKGEYRFFFLSSIEKIETDTCNAKEFPNDFCKRILMNLTKL